MFKINKQLLVTLLLLLMAITFKPACCFANSAEPPSILIIVPHAPADLEIGIRSGNTYTKAKKINKVIESYYTFYSNELRDTKDYTFKIDTGDRTMEITLERPLKSYNNIFTLDLKNQILIPGKLLSRSIFLVSLRVILTLIIEAFVFLAFGFRHIRSWIAFLVINLMTQGVLNIWLNGFTPLASYMILTLIFGEILVFSVEIIAFLFSVKEHSSLRTIFYVLAANLLSLIAGGYIITVLPI